MEILEAPQLYHLLNPHTVVCHFRKLVKGVMFESKEIKHLNICLNLLDSDGKGYFWRKY